MTLTYNYGKRTEVCIYKTENQVYVIHWKIFPIWVT